MQTLRYFWILSLICLAKGQDYLNFPPLSYSQGSPYYQHQNYQPSFPPHFRPFGYLQQGFASPAYKPIGYHSIFPQQEQTPYQNDLRNPFISGFNSFYPQYPQYDESYPDLDEYNKVQPVFRDPIQLIPSRFPPRVESVVEKIQNRFSIYNPGLVVPNVPVLIEIPANETDVKPPTSEGTIEPISTVGEVSATPSGNLVSSTEEPAVESATDASEESTVRQDAEERISETEESANTPEQNIEASTEVKAEEVSTESSTDSTESLK